MLVVLTGINRNSKFDLVANASNRKFPNRFLRVSGMRF
jgi:hypothetical protein